jgi:hypothetical protein
MRKANSKMWAEEAPFPRPGPDVARWLGNLLCSGCVIRAHDIQAMLNYPGTPGGGYLTHFQGISGMAPGAYELSAGWSNQGGTIQGASLVTVPRNANGIFSRGLWTQLDDTGLPGTTSSNGVYGNALVGIVCNDLMAWTVRAKRQTINQISRKAAKAQRIHANVNQKFDSFIPPDCFCAPFATFLLCAFAALRVLLFA